MNEPAGSAVFSPDILKRAEAPAWDDCPVGTIAYHIMGGWWTKQSNGWWMWNGGDAFPMPGPDAHLVYLPGVKPPPDPMKPIEGIPHLRAGASPVTDPSREGVKCVGQGIGDGCGWLGGTSGDTCPQCGGMMLSKRARLDAARLAQQWAREAEPPDQSVYPSSTHLRMSSLQ